MIKKLHSFINGIECKECSQCKNYLSLDMFVVGNSSDGLASRCKICQKEYRDENREELNRKQREKHTPVELLDRKCIWCGKTFTPERVSTQRFCSKKCVHSHRILNNDNTEQRNEYYNTTYRQRHNISKDGSEEHKKKISGNTRYNWVEPLTKNCPNCGIEFNYKPSENKKFCSKNCYNEYAVVENHWKWKSNRDEIIRRDGKEFSYLQKKFIKERDEMICQLCGIETFMNGNKYDNSCHIDHKLPISRGGENDTSNGRVLCKKCNQNKHDKIDEEYLVVKNKPIA
jgi:endogenous inhibitor of DNA gyrase (YacG/DUF329 family)